MQADSFEEPPPESAMNVLIVASETSLSEIVRRTERLGKCHILTCMQAGSHIFFIPKNEWKLKMHTILL